MRRVRYSPVVLVVVLLATLAACSKQPSPDKAINAFVAGWKAGNFGSAVIVDPTGATVAGTDVATQIASMSGDLAKIKPTITVGTAKVTKQDATVPIDVDWPIAKGVDWKYQTTMPLTYKKNVWQVVWSPSVFAPTVKATDKLAIQSTKPARGQIMDGSGGAIASNQTVITIGVQPSLVTDINALVKALDTAFKSLGKDIDVSGLAAQVKAAKPTDFVTVVRLRDSDYQKIRAQIHDLPGTVFRSDTASIGPTTTFARALLGTVNDVTKEQMDKNPGKYVIGDQVGNGGLQGQYDDQLRGVPGISVVIPGVKAAGDDSTTTPDPQVLFHVDPAAGKTIKTTIDQNTQNAAEHALTLTPLPSAVVAIRISDGAILAVANGPAGSANDFALQAQVPPGSMFKAVTATNLLDSGQITVNTSVNCPASLTVGGYTFTNAGGEVLGNVPLHVDFAKSCNTAFASLAPKLGPTGLSQTAATLGIGVPWDLGIDAYTGKVSANGDPTEQAAAAFGQGTTTVSPVAMAAAAAALQRGQWKQPHLVLDPAPAKPAADGPALKPATVTAMAQMMREVVTSGTGVKCANVPGPPIYGKTGTAEFDSTDKTKTHSWFMGYRGDIAFAVFVNNGGASTAPAGAVAIAAAFFTSLG